MPREIDDRAPARRRGTVSDALDVSLRHDHGGIHRGRIRYAVDHIRMNENEGIIRRRLSTSGNRGKHEK